MTIIRTGCMYKDSAKCSSSSVARHDLIHPIRPIKAVATGFTPAVIIGDVSHTRVLARSLTKFVIAV